MAETETVLVTGGSGFIGSWCVIELLRRGYAVRTTVRDLAREAGVRASVGALTQAGDALSFHAANLTSDAGWDEAVAGADYVLHVASPLGVAEPKNADELIAPARDGALRVLGAAIRAGVKRVVMTSSVAASAPPHTAKGDSVSDETVWSDGEDPAIGAYARSKTIAEREAWALIASSGGATTLTTVNPALVLGPVLSGDFSESVQVVTRLLSGKVPGIPRLGFNIVDVRDVADLHIRCMTAPEAAGERFIAAGQFAWMSDIADILRANLGAQASKVPTGKAPDWLLRLVSVVDRDLTAVTPNLGRRRDFTAAKAKSVLAWTARPLQDTILDCAKSLIAAGAV
jgi:nucleoside-diphosphate-sugar epimerase